MTIGPMSTTFFPEVLPRVALSHCFGAGMLEGIAVGVVGFLLSSIALGLFTWSRSAKYGYFRRTLITVIPAAGGGVIVGLVGLSVTMVIAFSRCS